MIIDFKIIRGSIIELPMLTIKNYHKGISASIIETASQLGPIIRPQIDRNCIKFTSLYIISTTDGQQFL